MNSSIKQKIEALLSIVFLLYCLFLPGTALLNSCILHVSNPERKKSKCSQSMLWFLHDVTAYRQTINNFQSNMLSQSLF